MRLFFSQILLPSIFNELLKKQQSPLSKLYNHFLKNFAGIFLKLPLALLLSYNKLNLQKL
jgi:hypothetical protein